MFTMLTVAIRNSDPLVASKNQTKHNSDLRIHKAHHP